MSEAPVSHRVIILANPHAGVISPSWRLKCSLEAAGNVAFWFTPDRWPQLFEGGRVRLDDLGVLLRRWSVGVIVACDGVQVASDCKSDDHAVLAVFAATSKELSSSLAGGCGFDACLALGEGVRLEAQGRGLRALAAEPVCDACLHRARIVNDIALASGIACFQDATPERIDHVRSVSHGRPIRCLGEGWPAEWRIGTGSTDAAYALAAADELVVCDGAKPSALDRFYASCREALRCGAEDAPRVSSTFDEGVEEFLDGVLGADEGAAGGTPGPARIATVLGYVGRGNFGDEYILSTIAERLAERCPGTVTVAVGEDPWHTLINRGIYAITLADKAALEGMLSRSSVALAMAGLLFDQGIRWTMGEAELLSSVSHTDIPGMAGFVGLAHLNEVPVVFYGIGAGPLKNRDSKRLVRLMGTLGVRFACRDAETARLISACGVPDSQVVQRADVAFTGASRRTKYVDGWLAEHALSADDKKLVVVSLREYENVPEDFAERIARACDMACERHDEARFVFCILDASDRALSERVVAAMAHADRAFVFDAGDDIDAMGDMICRAHAGLSMRYHCSLLLFRSGVPCVGLGYLPKVEALYEEVGLAEEGLLPMDATSGYIAGALSHVLEDWKAGSTRVSAGAVALAELARSSEDELVELLEHTPAAAVRIGVPEQFFLFDAAASDRELRDVRARLRDAEARLADAERAFAEARARVDELEQSNSFRVGSALMRLPGKLKRALGR